MNTAYKVLARMRAEMEMMGDTLYAEYLKQERLSYHQMVIDRAKTMKFIYADLSRKIATERKTMGRMYMDECEKDIKYGMKISKELDSFNETLLDLPKVKAHAQQRRFWDRVYADIAKKHGLVLEFIPSAIAGSLP